ncbi:MAG: thioesterase family protein, partial [Parvibaculum sp.]
FSVGLALLTTGSLIPMAGEIAPLLGISSATLATVSTIILLSILLLLGIASRNGLTIASRTLRLPDTGTLSRQFLVTVLDVAFSALGIGWDYTQKGEGSCFTAEVHVCYLDEVKEGDPLRVTYQLLDADEKRIHVFGHMYHAEKGYLAATSEQMCIHVDMKSRRASPFPAEQQARIAAMMNAHEGMPRPVQAGRVIGIKRK